MRPELLTFDIFGTVLDWRAGLERSVREAGHAFDPARDLDRVIDLQARDEQAPGFRDYRAITEASLVAALGLGREAAAGIAARAGSWPLFGDSREGLRRLLGIAPCAAMSNSDRVHGEQVQEQLGFRLPHWICAEDARVYKPDTRFWSFASERTGVPFGRRWWHVSAYADYDLETARELGLTCVFIPRPHARPGFSHHQARDLLDLAARISALP